MGAMFQPGDTVRRVSGVGPADAANGMFPGRLYRVARLDRFLHLEGTVGAYYPPAFELVSRPEPKAEPLKAGDRVRILEIPGVTHYGKHKDQGKVVQVTSVSPGKIYAGGWYFNPEDLEKVAPAREGRDASLTGILRGFWNGQTDIVLTRDLITQLFERD